MKAHSGKTLAEVKAGIAKDDQNKKDEKMHPVTPVTPASKVEGTVVKATNAKGETVEVVRATIPETPVVTGQTIPEAPVSSTKKSAAEKKPRTPKVDLNSFPVGHVDGNETLIEKRGAFQLWKGKLGFGVQQIVNNKYSVVLPCRAEEAAARAKFDQVAPMDSGESVPSGSQN